jgi:excinuclease UvrABC helicase subunit UvrB
MKKHTLISILLLIVGYNLIGFMAAFQAIRSEWRQSVRVELAKVAENDLVRFVFSNDEFDISEKEFKHEGRYYDIIEVQTHGDSLTVLCFDDATETRLSSEFHDLIVKNNEQNSDFQHKTTFCFQLLIKDFYFPTEKIEKKTPSVHEPFLARFNYKNRFFSSQFLPTDTPPPNVSLNKACFINA